MIGQEITDRYYIEEQLGAGGMGTVYRGVDSQTKQRVAIKQLHPSLTNAELIERFKREGEALRELNHPNIVKMLDAVKEDGSHYLIMEYVSGGDLSTVLAEEKLPLEKILNIAIDLADALTRAHRLNIIHRDLKPANVLVADDGTLRLTDFGVAHVGSKERVTDTDAIIGTVDYLPPEAFDNTPYDERGDIWAFGVMLFEMIAGERPFKGQSIVETIFQISTGEIPDLEAQRSDIPVALIDLVYRMLERNIDARVRSVRQIGLELEDILQGRTHHTPQPTRFVPTDSDVFAIKKHNLPLQTTPFVGRDTELGELSKLITDTSIRLMTIIAPGGMGKTRLALEAAARHLDKFEDGVYFVELAPLTLPEQIIPAIATAMDFKFQQGEINARQELLEYLHSKQILLVMDNYEHLLEGADLVTDILKATTDVQILATSRQRLAQQSENILHLSGMDFPDWETPEDAMLYAAVKLFVNSARRVQSDFELTVDNLDYVARICKQVQGMPLGIVLSGAWIEMLSVKEIADELVQSIDILSDEIGELPERQQSIRVVMDYAWQMMNAAEQSVFMKLSVFKGGFTREAAQAVAGANLRNLMSLVTKSLIRRDADSGRYEIHELLRQYAHEKLDGSGRADKIYAEHAQYFSDFINRQLPLLKGGGQMKVLDDMDSDYENCHAAWVWSVAHQNATGIDPMIDSLYWYFHYHFQFDAGYRLFELARQQWSLTSPEPELLAVRLSVRFIGTEDRAVVQPILEKCLTLAEKYKQPGEIAFCQRELGRSLGHHSSDGKEVVLKGIEYLNASLENYRQMGDKHLEAVVLDDLGYAYIRTGNIDKSLENSGQSLELRKNVGDMIGYGECLNGYSVQLVAAGKLSEALDVLLQARKLAYDTHNIYLMNMISASVGFTHLFVGDFTTSLEVYKSVYNLSLVTKNERWRLTGQFGIANLLVVMDGDMEQAMHYLQNIPPDEALIYNDSAVAYHRWAAAVHYFAKTKDDEGLYQGLQYLITYWTYMGPLFQFTSFIPLYAYWEGRNKNPEQAVRWLAFAHHYEVTNEVKIYLNSWSIIIDFRESLRAELGDEKFDALWEAGKLMDKQTVFEQIMTEFSDD